MLYRFEVYKDNKGEFRFKALNGEDIFASEGCKQKQFYDHC